LNYSLIERIAEECNVDSHRFRKILKDILLELQNVDVQRLELLGRSIELYSNNVRTTSRLKLAFGCIEGKPSIVLITSCEFAKRASTAFRGVQDMFIGFTNNEVIVSQASGNPMMKITLNNREISKDIALPFVSALLVSSIITLACLDNSGKLHVYTVFDVPHTLSSAELGIERCREAASQILSLALLASALIIASHRIAENDELRKCMTEKIIYLTNELGRNIYKRMSFVYHT